MEKYPKLLDLMSKRKWHEKKEQEAIDEKNLQLSLGPPGDDNSMSPPQQPSFAYFCEKTKIPLKSKTNPNSPQFQTPSWSPQNASKQSCTVNNSDHKRTAPTPVVGWPPIRSFRKNLASNSSLKSSSELPNEASKAAAVTGEKPADESNQKGLFVKINMDGIPIGRKVDLKACDGYEKLSSVVDHLFRGLLAAQSDSCEGGLKKKNEGKTIISGLLDMSGEYTLVYEDNEGDRMLVGDVPWHMFVSTVKRLRVLKTSELPMLRRGAKQGKLMSST